MKDARQIILEPILTEKALRLKDEANQYFFKVDKNANKIEVRTAITKRFSVRVKNVRIINVKGKPRQRFTSRGRVEGFTPAYKKAIVTLHKDDTLDFLENL